MSDDIARSAPEAHRVAERGAMVSDGQHEYDGLRASGADEAERDHETVVGYIRDDEFGLLTITSDQVAAAKAQRDEHLSRKSSAAVLTGEQVEQALAELAEGQERAQEELRRASVELAPVHRARYETTRARLLREAPRSARPGLVDFLRRFDEVAAGGYAWAAARLDEARRDPDFTAWDPGYLTGGGPEDLQALARQAFAPWGRVLRMRWTVSRREAGRARRPCVRPMAARQPRRPRRRRIGTSTSRGDPPQGDDDPPHGHPPPGREGAEGGGDLDRVDALRRTGRESGIPHASDRLDRLADQWRTLARAAWCRVRALVRRRIARAGRRPSTGWGRA